MKRILLLISALPVVLLLLPSGASARIVELGAQASTVTPSCPADPCEAAVRVTGLQGRSAGGPKNPYYIRRAGYIVAFTVTLAKPNAEQIAFFNDNFGSPAQVGLSVLRRGDKRKTRLNYRLIAQSDLYDVDRYFGSSPTFVLDRPLRVKKDELDRGHGAELGADVLQQPDALGLVALVPRQGQLRAAAQPAPVRDAGAARRERVRLHLPRRAAALHGHVRAGSETDRRVGRPVGELGALGLSPAIDPR